MRIFAPARPEGRSRRAESGFTLVELMVVLALLALATTAVIITMPASGSAAQAEADRLALRVAALRDLAIVEGRPAALVVSPSGYAFERQTEAGWEPLSGRGFARRDWPAGVGIAASSTNAALIRVSFDTMGMTAAPQKIVLSDGDGRAALTISATGGVTRGE
jgi:general secretion pathway protein H